MSLIGVEERNIINARKQYIPKITKAFWITFILCMAFVIQDIFTRDDIFLESNKITLHVMENTSHGYEWWNRRVSTISMLADAIMIACAIWITPRQIDALYLIIVTVLSLFQMTFLKSIYRDPRPYFVDLNIVTHECGPEFGNPSGHGVNNLVMIYVSFYIVDNDCFLMLIRNEQGKIRLHHRRFWINLIGLILCIIIGWARICLGMHSLNQILLGWALGVIWVIVYISLFYRRFRYFWAEVMREEGFTKRKKILLTVLILSYIVLTGICILVYEMNDRHFDIPEMWIKGIEQTCKKEFDDDMRYVSTYHKTFSDMGVYGATFGVMLGFLFMEGNYDEKKLLYNYSKQPKKKFVFRIISDLLLLVLFFGVPWISVQFIEKKYVYLKFFIGFNLASVLGGLSMVLVRNHFYKLLRCSFEGDLNYRIPNRTKKVIILIEDTGLEQNPQSENSNQQTSLKENNDAQKSSESKIPSENQIIAQQVNIQNNNEKIPDEQQNIIDIPNFERKINNIQQDNIQRQD